MIHKVAVIGCGDQGKSHANAWNNRDDASVVAVFDTNEERRRALAESMGARACESLEDAVVKTDVDFVSVCTPVCFHCDISCLAMNNGRHVLCEKPISLILDDADRMINTAMQNHVKLGVSYQYRGFSKYLKYRELFRSGIFGGPIFARFVDVREVRPKTAMHRNSLNGGPLVDMAGHFFDLMHFFTGAIPQRVYASGHVFGKGKKRLEGIPDLAIDAAEITVDYSGGHVLSVFINWGMPEGFRGMTRGELTGPDAMARTSGNKVEVILAGKTETHEISPSPAGPSVRISDLLEAVNEDREPEVSGIEGRRALSVSLLALESIKRGQSIDVTE